MKSKTENALSTFDQFMQNPKQKEKFDKEYSKFLVKEFLLEAMNENHISVRKLAEESGISTSIIQNIRSEKATNITFSTLNSLMTALGYRVKIEKIDNKAKRKKTKSVV
jgi:DNA-binding Xre family transcriptional regulator